MDPSLLYYYVYHSLIQSYSILAKQVTLPRIAIVDRKMNITQFEFYKLLL